MKKQNYSYIGISFVILVFGILFVPKILNRITNKEIVDKDRHHLERKGKESEIEMVTIGKVPEFKFINQRKDTITNESYEGKVYVAEFFFTTCPSICPIMNQNMLKVQEAFQGNTGVGIASITINPEYDTADVLNEYAKSYGITHPNWHLLTGDRGEIYQLANTGFNLYVGAAPEVEGGFEHSGFFALIDQDGNIRSRKDENGNPIIYYDGLEADSMALLIQDINILLNQ
jgi:protein SCO1/2